jgi:hypothetical protein
MEEKEILKSLPYTGKVLMIIFLILGILLSAYFISNEYIILRETYNLHEHLYWCYSSKHIGDSNYLTCEYSEYDFADSYALNVGMEHYIMYISLLIIVPMIFFLILRLLLKTFGMVITDKRISGWSILQLWRTDLPLDMIQSVSLIGFTGISVRTAGGRIVLFLIRNRRALHNAICELLIQRNTPPAPAEVSEPLQESPAECNEEPVIETDIKQQLLSLKELLDLQVITQEDYDTKKNQILDL